MSKTQIKIKGHLPTSPVAPMPCSGSVGILTKDWAPPGKVCIEFRKRFFTTDGNDFDPQGRPIKLYIPEENVEAIAPVAKAKNTVPKPLIVKPTKTAQAAKLKKLAKVDIHNDFRDFPKLFTCPDDIEQYIRDNNVEAPVLLRFLELRKGTLLDLTPTEDGFIFEHFFDYIYDVFRVPVPETYKSMNKWISEYLEGQLVTSGIEGLKAKAYEAVRSSYENQLHFMEIFADMPKVLESRRPKVINFFPSIELKYPRTTDWKGVIETFFIRTDRHSIQPFTVGKEAYAEVTVQPKRVYICGCDDFSYTLTTKNSKEAKAFANYLKCASPVWNFNFAKSIHPALEFTN